MLMHVLSSSLGENKPPQITLVNSVGVEAKGLTFTFIPESPVRVNWVSTSTTCQRKMPPGSNTPAGGFHYISI